MPKIIRFEEVPLEKRNQFLDADEYAPFYDKLADDNAPVWAVYRDAAFSRKWQMGLVRYIDGLGWQPEGARGFEWEVSEWMYLPHLPDWAVEENVHAML